MKHSVAWFSFILPAMTGVPAETLGGPDPAAEPFDLADVRLLDGPFKEAQERGKAYILRVDVDRLMHWFRVKNGLPSSAQPYWDWVPTDYGRQGHYEGHYLSACARMYAATGDARFKERLDRAVAILAECQAAAKPAGYLGIFPESWLRMMAGLEPNTFNQRFPVPWYCLHKVYAGLVDAWELGGNRQARDIMVRVMDWMQAYAKPIGDAAFEKMLDQEHGGINEAIANLAALTKDPAHLALARRFCHRALLDPLSRNEDILDGLHANTQVPKFTGFARLHELTGDAAYRDAARNFWWCVTEERSYAIGGNSDHEKFTPKAHLSHNLSNGNCETCNTHNMLKLTRHLLSWEPRAAVADYYERALINHILSSQNPESGTVTYFHPLEGGSRKSFSPDWVTAACCHGSGLENPARYGDAIYLKRGGERLFVNLFLASELNWKEAGLTVRQTTRFPEEAASTIAMAAAKPVAATISLRKPGWAGAGFAVRVNGQPVASTPGAQGYVDVTRAWANGDTISVALPMTFRWEGFRDNPDRVALFHGPVLMAAVTEEGNRLATVLKPAERALDAIRPSSGKPLRFTADPAIFRRDLELRPVELQPLYRTAREFYSVYWDLLDEAQRAAGRRAHDAEVARWKELATRTVDIAFHDMALPRAACNLPGVLAADPTLPRTAGADRTEAQHAIEAQTGYNNEFNLIQRHTAGRWQTFRTIEKGMDRFGWTLNIEPGKPQTLLVRLWSPPANDPEARRATECGLDVRVAAVKAAETSVVGKNEKEKSTTQGNQLDAGARAQALPPTTSLGAIGPAPADGSYREVRFPIPANLVAGKDRLMVRFVRKGGKVPGLVGEVRVLRD